MGSAAEIYERLLVPAISGMVTQYTGSLQTGCLTLGGLTSVGIIAGLLYPSLRPSAGAAEVIGS